MCHVASYLRHCRIASTPDLIYEYSMLIKVESNNVEMNILAL